MHKTKRMFAVCKGYNLGATLNYQKSLEEFNKNFRDCHDDFGPNRGLLIFWIYIFEDREVWDDKGIVLFNSTTNQTYEFLTINYTEESNCDFIRTYTYLNPEGKK